MAHTDDKRTSVGKMKEVATLVSSTIHSLKQLTTHEQWGYGASKVHCTNFFGDEVEFVDASMQVKRYHKGIEFPRQNALEEVQTTHVLYLSHNVVLENHLLGKNQSSLFRLQSDDSEESRDSQECRNDQVFVHYVRKHIEHLSGGKSADDVLRWLGDQIEHLVQLTHWYKKCTNTDDFYKLTQLAYRLFTGKSLVRAVMDRLFAPPTNVQGDNFGDFLRILRGGLTSVQRANEAPLVQKVVSLYSFLMVQGFLTKFGITLSDEEYSKIEQKALLVQFSSRKELWLSVMDTTLFICERVYEFKQTGDISVFLHSSSAYSEWLKKADKILALAPFSSNLVPHGTTYFSYVADINDLVERGEAYAKYTNKTSGTDSVLLKRKLMSLQLLKNTELTRRASQKERRAPFGVLVHGCSSVAKSTFTKMLYYYYGSLHGLDTSDHHRYVRNPADEYWSNFDSSKWCIQLDDIAFLLPSKSSEVDPTLKEMLNVVNNVPYVPPQAALEDKGKTPVMAKLVVATSNAKDLNAQEYFWCPLAVRRRLPFVVEVTPKQEYLHENQRFIDPAKLPETVDAFPDFWNIKVQKILPHFDGQRDRATLGDVQTFTNSGEFLKYFGEESLKHETTQDKSMTCDTGMSALRVCPLCKLVSAHCECAMEVQSNTQTWMQYLHRCIYNGSVSAMMYWLRLTWCINLITWTARYRLFRGVVVRHVLGWYPAELQMQILGRINSYQNIDRNWRLLLVGLAALTSGAALYFSLRTPRTEEREKKGQESPVPMEEQGNVYGTTEDQFEKEARANVWYNPTMELTTFDVPLASQSLVGASSATIRDLFSRNCVRLEIASRTSIPYKCGIGAVFVRGHYCLVNNHAFREGIDDFDVTVVQTTRSQGITPNLTLRVRSVDMVRDRENDLCIFEVRSLPPFKDITKFWSDKPIDITRGTVVRRVEDGTTETQEVFGIAKSERFPIEALGISPTVYIGTGPRDTRPGDCGALLLANTPRGVIVVGIHTLGYSHHCGTMYVSLERLETMISDHKKVFGVKVEVQGGGKPQLHLGETPVPLVEPHHRSLFRYLPTGVLNIYGSFAGFRPRPRSRVGPTPLTKVMQEHFQCTIQHGKPCMEGWLPWKKNIVEMVEPRVVHDKLRLSHCVKSFAADILRELPEAWEKELMFLSRRASVNGLPGVIFIDRLNANSSMGFPWNKSKKGFLTHFADEVYPDGIDFDEAVWERVDVIDAAYAAGKRAYPIYTGHLKDEPTALEKVAQGKTRVFTGAPVDWSIAVRMRLLTFVRLVQRNKFAFEAGPGTVCQSDEWGVIYDYLTAFGKDQIVAGDYSKYDKRMLSDFIIAAFEVIITIYEAAGFEESELRELLCIGEDIAFPLVNMNGDLVEFFGTNPSGHPLTVIINSLVNSLYMRYCYATLSADGRCTNFKKDVHLFTYGDDNIMGVAPTCPWFNHTAIQSALADIGVGYTMADKEAESVPFVDIASVSFLKRTWRFDEDVGTYLCPLEEASLHKSLTMWLPSKSIDEYAQMVAVISSANSEYFFYGRETFQKHHNFFKQVLAEEPYSCYVGESTLPTWEELYDRFWRASKGEPPERA